MAVLVPNNLSLGGVNLLIDLIHGFPMGLLMDASIPVKPRIFCICILTGIWSMTLRISEKNLSSLFLRCILQVSAHQRVCYK